MNRSVIGGIAAAVLLSCSYTASAELEPYKDYVPSKEVWNVAFVKVNPNRIDEYLAGIRQTWLGGCEVQKKLGTALDCFVYVSETASNRDFNVMLGSAYFQRMLNTWDGSVPLAVASYNAGPGNVRKWINAYGDPRTRQVDMIGWIEAIPFTETRGYVQRVIENCVVYDSINPEPATRTSLHVSRYLGKSHPG